MHTKCVKRLTIFVFSLKPADTLLRISQPPVRHNQYTGREPDTNCVFFVQLTRPGNTGRHQWNSENRCLSRTMSTLQRDKFWHCFLHALTKPLSF